MPACKPAAGRKSDLALSASQWQQLPADPRGEAVELHSRDLPGVRWQGNIERLSHNIDANTRLRTLTVSVEQPFSQQPQPCCLAVLYRFSSKDRQPRICLHCQPLH